jgi:hypothetical protein
LPQPDAAAQVRPAVDVDHGPQAEGLPVVDYRLGGGQVDGEVGQGAGAFAGAAEEQVLGAGQALHLLEDAGRQGEGGFGQGVGDVAELRLELLAGPGGGGDGRPGGDADDAEQQHQQGSQELVADGPAHGG